MRLLRHARSIQEFTFALFPAAVAAVGLRCVLAIAPRAWDCGGCTPADKRLAIAVALLDVAWEYAWALSWLYTVMMLTTVFSPPTRTTRRSVLTMQITSAAAVSTSGAILYFGVWLVAAPF